MNIVIMGPKGAGKSSVGMALSELTGFRMVETDTLVEEIHARRDGHQLSCREIYAEHGERFFREVELEAAREVTGLDWCILVTGGSMMLEPEARSALRQHALLLYLVGEPDVLWERAIQKGVPPWLEGPTGPILYKEQVAVREDVLRPYADIVLDTSEEPPEVLAERAYERIGEELAIASRSANTFGEVIRMTTFGESHGPAIGAVLDGLWPGVEISEERIQAELDRRRPGQSKLVTRRKESDTIHILSGVFEGKTTGAPLAMVIYNEDQRSRNYDDIKDLFRPGHADFTFYKKYGTRDYRGGGRSSGRETACRVACGAVARDILADRGVRIVAHAVEIAGIPAETCDYDVIEENPVRCADPIAAERMAEAIIAARKGANSVGGIIQLDVTGLPSGLGDPVFAKLDARITAALMTIGAVKGVEVGDGFRLARLRGDESNDGMAAGEFLSNHAGGILGGISTGEPVKFRVAVKPTSSIAKPQRTMDIHDQDRDVETHGRHDPCIVPRAVPVVEHMAALALLDAWEVQNRLRPDWEARQLRS
jgi:chorismate synthase